MRVGGLGESRGLVEVVRGWLDGVVDEEALVAVLRAGGFTDADAIALTGLLADTGDRLDLSSLGPLTVDKHSTGGVGDGTTLLAVPLLASAGATVVKLSGRGLGHTGGTVDKLESVPGLRTELGPDELLERARAVGCTVAAQSDRMVPGDRALYALRHATGTVADAALIASSVMAKKLAAGARTIVLDVKAGDGAFMAGVDEAVALARLCVRIGAASGRRCVALVTAMDQPLGRAVGNALEVAEAVELLARPPRGRLAVLAVDLAAEALALARGDQVVAARRELVDRWAAGEGLARLRAMVAAQGGDPRVCDDPRGVLPRAPVQVAVHAAGAGWVSAVPARAVGQLAAALGAGRRGKSDPVDPAAGIELAVAVGDRLETGDLLGVVHARTDEEASSAAAGLVRDIRLGPDPVAAPRTVLDRVTA